MKKQKKTILMNNNNNYVIKECTAYCAISLFKKKDFKTKKWSKNK